GFRLGQVGTDPVLIDAGIGAERAGRWCGCPASHAIKRVAVLGQAVHQGASQPHAGTDNHDIHTVFLWGGCAWKAVLSGWSLLCTGMPGYGLIQTALVRFLLLS